MTHVFNNGQGGFICDVCRVLYHVGVSSEPPPHLCEQHRLTRAEAIRILRAAADVLEAEGSDYAALRYRDAAWLIANLAGDDAGHRPRWDQFGGQTLQDHLRWAQRARDEHRAAPRQQLRPPNPWRNAAAQSLRTARIWGFLAMVLDGAKP